MARGSGKSKSKTHIKVKRKDKILKRDIEKPKEEKEPDDMVDAEGFVCLPPAQDLPEELEQELEAFRAKKVIFADQIQEQLKETQTFDPTVKKVYTEIGKLLRYYRSGKIPKAFKLVPRLERWEDVLDLAKPEDWSPCAMYQATKIFISSMNPKQAQRFLVRWLTPAIRKNIHDYKKLNYHYYQALKKATYKPAAWFKGILLPICYDGNCTLKEAQILGSIITKVSTFIKCGWPQSHHFTRATANAGERFPYLPREQFLTILGLLADAPHERGLIEDRRNGVLRV